MDFKNVYVQLTSIEFHGQWVDAFDFFEEDRERMFAAVGNTIIEVIHKGDKGWVPVGD